MELETVLSELKQLKDDFAELKNKFESLLGRAGWNYIPAAAPAPINMIKCAVCGWFYSPGMVHSCPTNTFQPNFQPIIFTTAAQN